MGSDYRLPSLYQPESVAELLTSDTVRKLLLGFTAGLDWLATALQEKGGARHDLWGTPERYWGKFCRQLRVDLNKTSACHRWDRKVAHVLLGEVPEDYPGQKKEFEGVFRCHAGILDFAEVIRVGERPLAVLHGGQLVHSEDMPDARFVRDKLTKSGLGLTDDQIESLIQLLNEDKNAVVTEERLNERVGLFRKFARELEALLNKLYRERRHATEEVLLHGLAAYILSMNATSQPALWESISKVFTELRSTMRLAHIEWFMGSEEERFHLTAKTNSTEEWSDKTLLLGSFWQDLIHYSGATMGKRWDATLRRELDLAEDAISFVYPTTCVYGAPLRNIPALLVIVCHKPDADLLEEFLPRFADEVTRGISTAISEIETNRAIQTAAAKSAFVGHDMKAPLHVLVNVVPAIRACITRLGISDRDLLDDMRICEAALKSAREKATELENMPVREFVVQPRKKRTDLALLLDPVITLVSSLGIARGVTVQWRHRPDEPVLCDLDQRYMLVALHAVLDNAVKFSFAAKTVDVSLEVKSGHKAILKVSNLGVGIPPEKRIVIFEFRSRGEVEDPKGIKRPGSGLGLPFAKRIIEAHQGTIQISSHSTLHPPPEKDDCLSHVVEVTIRLPTARSM